MSLADQSQQWFPTSVQVTVHQARSLRVKGKNGTNDAYAIIQVAKDKFSTSVAEKCVAPVWKEEASFDLPLFHPGNADRCTLYIVVMHRAQVGLDKFLGQAVVNLLELHDNKGRKKTDWYKLVDKTGKEDKARGEVLLDIQFMRNNMSASMFDLSMQDKPRSRISKLKDKVRGKKKDGFSDSASAIVPSVSQVLTDSDGEADSVSLNQATGEPKKKSKLKTLFAPKSNLQRNISQSMSTLGTLPEKNSSVSSSRSSGLNIDSPDVKKKFKFLGHKRTGSSDSKVSQGPFSLLGRSKQNKDDPNSLCINGNHVYAEDTEPKSGSTLSLNSSGPGSFEDISADIRGAALPSQGRESAEKAAAEQQRHQEELERKQAEERRAAEAKRLEEEKYRAEAKRMQEEEQRRLQEEQEFKRRFLEDEERRRKQKEEEEEERRKLEEKRRREAAEKERLEEQKTQEDASMSDRLSSLFGMIKKKEEKKEEEEPSAVDLDQMLAPKSTNPFEDMLDQRNSHNAPVTPAGVFLSRTAKVSAVKPRLTHSVTSDSPDCQTPSQQCPSPDASETTLSSVPSESPETFSTLHTSLAPTDLNQSPRASPAGSVEDLSSVGSSPTMADKKRRAPLPPLYETQTREIHAPTRDFKNPSYVESNESQQGRQGPLPLPDYESLFPQKRHGVKGNTGWDHLIAEVNQKHRDAPPELMGPEMSVDAPEVHEPRMRTSPQPETPAVMRYQTHSRDPKPLSTKKVAAPAPPKPAASAYPSVDYESQRPAEQSPAKPNPSPLNGQINSDTSSRENLPGISRDGARQALQPPPRAVSQTDSDTAPAVDQRKEPAPTARPRQKVAVKDPPQQEPSAVTAALSHTSTSGTDKKDRVAFDPFPSTGLLSADPWAQPKPKQEADDLFTRSASKEQSPQDRGMSVEDLDKIFSQDKPTDPFTGFSRNNSLRRSENGIKDEVSQMFSAAFQRKNSQKRRQNSASMTDKPPKAQAETAHKDERAVNTPKHPVNGNTQQLRGGDNPFGAEPFTVPSSLTSSDPTQVSVEEPAQQLSGGKPPLRAWVSPSEVQTVSAQNNNGGGLAPSTRRPHPVKPLSPAETQNIFSNPTLKDIRLSENIPGKFKVADEVGSGPYTQLTQEELITLVVKQQADLSKKDAKIMELEEYIDNLLVRVIDEKPSILNAVNIGGANVSSA